MRMSNRKRRLVLAAVLLSCTMLFVVPIVTDALGPLLGFLGVLALYWICFCVPVALFFGRGPSRISLRLRTTEPWVPFAALALPVGFTLVAKPWHAMTVDPQLPVLAVICALINGPLEEMAWRRAFRANSGGSLRFELMGLGLFTLWHVPLSLSEGIAFDHGAVGLIGGALVPGAVWMAITRRNGSIGWPTISHTLLNLAAFLPLFSANFAP